MQDYSKTPLSQTLGAKPGTEVLVLFTTSREELERGFEAVQRIGLDAGLVDDKSCSIDDRRRCASCAGGATAVSITAVEGFDFVHREQVRFRDLDAMGHVNNAVFATYVEQARIEYLRNLGVLDGPLYMGMILARLEVDFLAPAQPEGEVEIGVRASRSGTKSFELEYELQQEGRPVARATTVLVAYDYERAQSVPLPDGWREQLAVPA